MLAADLARAVQLLRAGRPGEAIGPLRAVAAARPGDAAVQHDLGLACLEMGLAAEAAAAFARAIAAKPGDARAHLHLGIARERLGDTAGAVAAYDRATALRPGLAEAWYRAGALVETMGQREPALGCFRRAAAAAGRTPFGRLAEARAYLLEGQDADAERKLRQVLALDRGNAVAHDLLGNLLAEAGRFAEARDHFAAAVAHGPLLAGSYYELVRCRPIAPDDADLLPRMAAALTTPGLEPAQQLRVHLALGKAAADLERHEEAMRHYQAADAVRRTLTDFDPAAFAHEIGRLIAHFSAARIGAARGGADDPAPVLIVGMPRSGTTLVEQILGSHPAVASGGELNFWSERGPGCYEHATEAREPGFLAAAAADYLALLRTIGPEAARITDKRPFNFLWAGLIHMALPCATIIHCRRAAIDTALSIQQTHFTPGLAFPTGGPELVAYFAEYHRLMAHWRRVMPPARFVEIDYEALTADPEQAIRRVVAACGLPWHEACLHPERNPNPVRTPSKWQARQPIYRAAAGKWRPFAPWLGPLAALADS